VTRTPQGDILILRSGLRIITTIHELTEVQFGSVFNSSDNLFFWGGKGAKIDNLVVGRDLPTTTTTTSTTTTSTTTTTGFPTYPEFPIFSLLLLISGAAIVIVVLVVLRLKSR
jgi:hypothetical protein